MNSVIFIVMVGVVCADFVFERVLDWLNVRAMSPVLPSALSGIYDEKEYGRFQNYKRENERLGLLSGSVSFLVLLLFLSLGGFGWWNGVVVSYTENTIAQTLGFMLGVSLVSEIISFPFDWYATFHIEEKYGFNKMTVRTYLSDMVKNMVLSVLLGGVLLAVVVWFYECSGPSFWWYAWMCVTVFSVFMAMFYSRLIVPLFNKQTPLTEGSLRLSLIHI